MIDITLNKNSVLKRIKNKQHTIGTDKYTYDAKFDILCSYVNKWHIFF
ncbi:hypothetical protein [Pediococcus damnosus]|nr:hypothetical protein [Pediococcus damnosus]